VIDFRVQPPFRSFLDMHFYEERTDESDPDKRVPFGHDRQVTPSMTSGSLELFLKEMDEAGLAHCVLVGQQAGARWGRVANEDIAELVDTYPDRFSGFGGLDPTEAGVQGMVEQLISDLGLSGISLIPGWSDDPLADDDPMVFPIYEACEALGVPVIITASHYIGLDMAASDPVHLQHVVEAFPKLTLIVGHGSWPWTMSAVALAMRYPNVFLMPEFYMYTPGMPGAQNYVDAANTFLSTRTLYSSCFPGRSLVEARKLFESLPLTNESRRRTMYHNAHGLLGLN
jgi:predicted TIM-barrel fold metal-dependent hydrolase